MLKTDIKNNSLENIIKKYNTNNNKNKSIFTYNQIKNFIKKVSNNRIFDLYLKYMGIKTLNSLTLVPIALIMGKNIFKNTINKLIKNKQKGGTFLEKKIPIIDDALLGNYLKITGLITSSLSAFTLLPLGILDMSGVQRKVPGTCE